MSQLSIQINEDRTAFGPDEELAGTVRWQFDQAPRTVELRLFWFTRGKGTEDAGVVETVQFDGLKLEEFRPFRLRLPQAPYSFSGKLISLVWALELVGAPSKEVARVEFVLAPGGQEVRLESLPESEVSKRSFAWGAR